MAICALVGNEIGAQKIESSLYTFKVVFTLSQIFNFAEFILLLVFRKYLVLAFTTSEEIATMTN